MTNYTQFVLSVESHSWHDPNQRLLHAAMGLCTETGELFDLKDAQHAIEEIGDVCWYLALAFDAIGESFEDTTVLDMDTFASEVRGESFEVSMVIYTTEVLDLLKKSIFYGRAIDHEKLFSTLAMIKSILWHGVANTPLGVTFDEVLDVNVAKLKKRYPEKFTEEAANNRDVKEEYAAMSR